MPRKRSIREIRADESKELAKLSRSRTEEYRLVERAQAMETAYQVESSRAIAKRLGRDADTIYHWFYAFQ